MAKAPLLLLCKTASAASRKLVAGKGAVADKGAGSSNTANTPQTINIEFFILEKARTSQDSPQVLILGFFVTESLQGIIRKRQQIGLELLGREDGFESFGNVFLQFSHRGLKFGVIQTGFLGNTGP